MPDKKITALDAITTVAPANDLFPIVDVSDNSMAASGTTKNITVNQLLGAGGTATLATATITGDLTVKTNVLKVDSTNNRVGIGTASPGKRCEINQSANAITTIGSGEILRLIGDDGNTNSRITEVGFGSGPTGATFAPVIVGAVNTSVTGFGTKDFYVATRAGVADVAALERYRIASDGVATWSNVGGFAGTAMTLNSTGLGVGVASPSYKLDVAGVVRIGGGVNPSMRLETGTNTGFIDYNNTRLALHAGPLQIDFIAGNTVKMTLDTSGNLLAGTTSSLAGSAHSFKATGTTSSFWAAAFSHQGTTANGRLQSWSIPNANDTGSYFVYASNSGGNCFNVLANGNVQNSSGTYGTISDLRLKENISDARNYLADLLKLRVVKYSLKSEQSTVATKIGFVAQEVEQVFPTLVETNGDDVKSIKTSILIPMLLKAIQELTARVAALEA